jgi:hypothetical protein
MAFNSDGEIDFIGSNSTTKSYRPDRIQGDVAEPPKWAARDADWGNKRRVAKMPIYETSKEHRFDDPLAGELTGFAEYNRAVLLIVHVQNVFLKK